MITAMRNFSTTLAAKILVGIIILAFVMIAYAGIFLSGEGPYEPSIEVGEVTVTRQDLENQLRSRVDLFDRMGLEIKTLEDYEDREITTSVVNALVRSGIWSQQASKLDLPASNTEISAAIAEQPRFNANGEFNEALFKTFVKNLDNAAAYEAQIAQQIVTNKLRNLPTQETPVLASAWQKPIAMHLGEKRSAAGFVIPRSVTADVEPTEEQLQTHLEENQENFRWLEHRDLEVIAFRADDVADKFEASEEEVVRLYEARKDSLAIPAMHAIETVTLETEEQAKALYDRHQAGEDWPALAFELSAKPPVSLGVKAEADLAEALASAAYDGEGLGSRAPVQTDEGYAVVNVVELGEVVPAKFEDHEEAIKKDAALSKARREIDTLAQELDYELGDGTSMKDAAEKLGLPYDTFLEVDRFARFKEGGSRAALLSENDELRRAAFDAAANEDPVVIEGADGLQYAYIVTQIHEPTDQTLEEARSRVEASYIREVQDQELEALAAELEPKLASGELSIEAAAADYDAEIETAETSLRADMRAAGRFFAQAMPGIFAASGEGSIVTEVTSSGLSVAKVLSVEAANPDAADEATEQQLERLASSWQNDVQAAFTTSLQDLGQYSIKQDVVEEAERRVTIQLGLQEGDISEPEIQQPML